MLIVAKNFPGQTNSSVFIKSCEYDPTCNLCSMVAHRHNAKVKNQQFTESLLLYKEHKDGLTDLHDAFCI